MEGLAILLGLFQELDQACQVTGHFEVVETKGRAAAWNALHAAYLKRIIAVLRSIELNYHAHDLITSSDIFKEHLTRHNGPRGRPTDIASCLIRPSHICDRDWRTKLCDFIERLSMAVTEVCDGVNQAAKDRPSGIKGTISKAIEDAEQRRLNPSRRHDSIW